MSNLNRTGRRLLDDIFYLERHSLRDLVQSIEWILNLNGESSATAKRTAEQALQRGTTTTSLISNS